MAPPFVLPIPFDEDNYAYLVVDGAGGDALLVDPGDDVAAETAVAVADHAGYRLREILLTHRHGDHVAGAPRALVLAPDARVVAPEADAARIRAEYGLVVHGLSDGETWTVGTLSIRALATPGHTDGSGCYLVSAVDDDGDGETECFTGDTLFGAGCGRMFDGPAAVYQASLARLAALPEPTRLWFGHEYTLGNLAFAAHVEPDNAAVPARLEEEERRLREDGRTVPSRLAYELSSNPFLRCASPDIVTRLRALDALDPSAGDAPAAVFAALRALKNKY